MNNVTTVTNISLYVGTYGKYNNGSIAGKWVNLMDYPTLAEFMEHCAEIHSDEQDAEFMFQDSDNVPSSLYCECSAAEIYKVIEFANENSIDNLEALFAHIGNVGLEYGLESFEEAYQGAYNSELDYAYEIVDEFFTIPKGIAPYFDYEKFSRDLFMSDYTYVDGFVFRNI